MLDYEPRSEQRNAHAEHRSRGRDSRGVAKKQCDHVSWVGAERQTNAQLALTLSD
jgi:hypothetical protein